MTATRGHTPARKLESPCTPEEAFHRWPPHRALAALWSAGGEDASRWTLLAEPMGETWTLRAGDPLSWPAWMQQPLRGVRELAAPPPLDGAPPFQPGWLGTLSYELGALLEPAATHRSTSAPTPPTSSWPLMHWQRFERALAYDHQTRQWWGIGPASEELLPPASAAPSVVPRGTPLVPEAFRAASLRSTMGRARFEAAARRAIEYIRAGDIYQANLTHPLRASFEGSARSFFASLARSASPWFGAFLEFDDAGSRRAIASASPELFLRFDPRSRRLTTRPMKGTRPAHPTTDHTTDPALAGDAALLASSKDNAELAMIVDLMRNDLGRVCELGSIRVEEPRRMERHASLFQTTALVSGTLAPGASLLDILRATFPGGSITGAPKIRAMQIIEELESTPRGPYCGSLGYVGDDASFTFNIAIRTAAISGEPGPAPGEITNGSLDYGVGAGIVVESDPAAEWDETIAKASAIARIVQLREH